MGTGSPRTWQVLRLAVAMLMLAGLVNTIPGAEAALVSSYWPAVGSYAGGTQLSIVLAAPLTSAQASGWVYCRFGTIIVFSAGYNVNATAGPTVTFAAPAYMSGKAEVDVAFSVTGTTFETFGKFIYHEPLMINAVEPAAGPVSGNHHIYVTFRNLNPLPSQLNRTETELLLEPMCAFPNVTVPGSFHVATAHFPWAYIRCNTPPWSAGAVNLSVSLNGQEWSVQPGTYTYLVTSQLSAADIAAYQAGNDPEAFTSWIDYQTDGSGIVTEFYNAFYGVAETQGPGYDYNQTVAAPSSFYYYEGTTMPKYPPGDVVSVYLRSLNPTAMRMGTPGSVTYATIYSPAPFPSGDNITMRKPTCLFGQLTPQVGRFYILNTQQATIECPIPFLNAPQTLPFRISLDGVNTSVSSIDFTLFADPSPSRIVNIPSVINSLQRFEAIVNFTTSPFPVNFTGFDTLANYANCQLDGFYSAAAVFPPDQTYPYITLRCMLSPKTWGSKPLYISLNNQPGFNVPQQLNFQAPPSGVNGSAPASPDQNLWYPYIGYALNNSVAPRVPIPLPYTASYRFQYRTDPESMGGFLGALTPVGPGTVSPSIAGNTTFAYNFTGNDPSSLTFDFTASADRPGCVITPDNVFFQTTRPGAIPVYVFTAQLNSGPRALSFYVIAKNGVVARKYSLTVTTAVLAVAKALTIAASTATASVPAPTMTPAFSPTVYSYSVTVDTSIAYVSFIAQPNIQNDQPSINWANPAVDTSTTLQPPYPTTQTSMVQLQAPQGYTPPTMCRNVSASAPQPTLGVGTYNRLWYPSGATTFSGSYQYMASNPTAFTCVGTTTFYVFVAIPNNDTVVTYSIRITRKPATTVPAVDPAAIKVVYGGGGLSVSTVFSNGQNRVTGFAITGTSIFQPIILTVQPTIPTYTIQVVPNPLVLNALASPMTLSMVLVSWDMVTTTTYDFYVYMRSGSLAGLFVGSWAATLGNYALKNWPFTPAFEGFTQNGYVATVSDSSPYVILTLFPWSPLANLTVSFMLLGCPSCITVPATDARYMLAAVQNSNSLPTPNIVPTSSWALNRTSVWVLPLTYGSNTVQVMLYDSYARYSNSYFVQIVRPSPAPADASLLQFSVLTGDGIQTLAAPALTAGVTSYTVTIPIGNINLLLNAQPADPSIGAPMAGGIISVTINAQPVPPTQIPPSSQAPSAPTADLMANNLQVTSSPAAQSWRWPCTFTRSLGAVNQLVAIVSVRSSGSAVNSYTFTLKWAKSIDASLTQLGYYDQLGSMVPLSIPSFTINGNQKVYTLTVGKGTSQVGFYAVSKDFWTTLGVATGVSMVSNPHDPGLIGPGAWTTKPWVYTLAPLRTPNLFTITATAEDGVTKQVFVITVIQDLSHDATLTAFQMSIQSRLPTYSVTPTVSPGTVLVPGVKGGATSATFSAPATVDPDASVAFSGDNVNWRSAPYTVPLVVGSNPVWVRVTAQDGTTVNLYTGSIEVPVDGSTLTALVPSVGFLDPPFASNVYSYQLKIPNNVPTVAFNATKSVSTSTVGATGWSLNFVPSTAGVLPIVVTALAGTGGSQTYSVRLVNLGDEGMMGYVLVSATQQGMNYQAPPGGPASPNPGGLVTNAGQTIQVTVTANCTKYFEDFGTGGGASCAGFGSTTTVQLFLVPTGGGNTVVTPSMTTVAAGVLAYTVVVPVGTYRVEVGARSILINHVALFQNLMVVPGITLNPIMSVLTLPSATIDGSGVVTATFAPADAFNNTQTAVPITVAVCPPPDASIWNSCPVKNLTGTAILDPQTAKYSLTYVTHRVGTYHVVVYDSSGTRVSDGTQIVGLDRSTPIDANTSLAFWAGVTQLSTTPILSIIVVPKDKYGNAIQVSDDMSSLALALTPPAGVLLNPAVNATTYSIKTGTAAVFAFKLSVSMVVPAGTYVAAPSAHGAPLNASGLTTVLGAALAFPSVTDWSQVPGLNASAGSPFSYVVQGRNGGNISLTFGGEGSAISVAMCSPARTTHTTAACPAFQQVAWTVLDYDNGNYLITVTAPPDVGTYQVQTRVNNVVLTEPVKTLNVLPPPPPPTPAPTPPGQTNITGVGLFTLLNRTVTPTAHNQSFSFADVNATLQPGLAFLFLLAAPANVTSVPPATFRSVPGPSPGLYSVNLATNYGGQYNLFVYLCGQPTCYDVMSAGNQLQTSARPILNLTESFPAGALSSFATTVDVASSIPLANAPSVLRITAKDAQRVVRAQQREASRFKVTADHALLTSPVVVDNLDGTYDAQFVPTEVAKYAVSVLLDNAQFFTLTLDAGPNPADASVLVMYSPMSPDTAGNMMPNSYSIQPRFTNYTTVNPFALTYTRFDPTGTTVIASGPIPNDPCTNVRCWFSFTPTVAAVYSVSATIAGAQVGKSPSSLVLGPDVPNATLSTVTLQSTGPFTAGASPASSVSLRDKYGNPGRATILASLTYPNGDTYAATSVPNEPSPSPLAFLSLSDPSQASRHTVTPPPLTTRGTYTVSIEALPYSVKFKGAPFVVLPGPPDPDNTAKKLLGTALQDGTVGIPLALSVVLTDAFKNALNQSDSPGVDVSLSVRLAADEKVNQLLTWSADGTTLQAAPFTLTAAGQYQVVVSMGPSGGSLSSILTKPVKMAAGAFVANNTLVTGMGSTVAGAAGTFTAQLRDAYNNPATFTTAPATLFSGSYLAYVSTTASVTLALGTPGGPLSVSAAGAGSPGLFTFSYTTPRAHPYTAHILIQSVEVPNVPAGPVVIPGPPVTGNAVGPGLYGGTVGDNLTFAITVLDSNSNTRTTGDVSADQLAVIISVTNAATKQTVAVPFQGPTFDPTSNQYRVVYTATTAGSLGISVTVAGTQIQPGGFVGVMKSGPISAAASRFGGPGLSGSIAGLGSSFTITSNDAFGNAKAAGGSAFLVSVLDTSCTPANCSAYVNDNADGTYTVAYKSATNGTYQLAVTLNGQPVGTATDVSSPLTLAILSPSTKRPIDVSKTLVSGVGLNGAVAGTAAGFKITTMDANSIPLAQGGVRFQLILNPSSNTTAKLIDNTDGTYQAVYSATVAANYTLTLTVNETIPVPALTAAKVTVVAGASAPEKTTLAGPGFAPSLVAGQSVQAVIVPADAYGNLVTYTSDYPPSKDVFSLRLYDGAGSAVRDVLVSAGTGQIFRPAMLLTASGNYSLQVLLAQKPIASGKAPVTVSPGPISPSMSYVSGANFAGATAGAPRPDGVALLDEFGNQVGAADGATCAVTFTSLAPGVPSVMAACAPARGNFVAAAPLNVSGTYQMTVTAAYGASNVTVTSGVPDTVTVQAGRPSAAQTTVSGIGVTVGGQAGKPASFSIAVKDDWGNEVANPSADGVAVTVTNVATGKATAGTVARADGNILRVTYSVTSSGTFQVAVKVDSVLIASGQNVLVNFTAAASSAANSYARLGGSPSNPQLTPGMVTAITAGQQAKLIVSAVDVFGSPQVDQKGAAKVPDQFVVTFDPPTTADGTSTGAVYSDAISNNDGTYTITFGANKTVAGAGTGSLTPIAYSLAVTLLTDAVTPAAISGSPFRFSLLPGPIDPSSSIISRAGTGETPAGLTSSFVLNTADIFGNPGQYVPGSFYTINGTAVAWAQPGNLSTGAGPRFSVFNNYDGSYGLTLTTPLAGQYNVTVRMSGVVVGSGQTPGLTFTGLAIPPGKRKRSSFTAAGDCIGSAACRAGTASRLIVQARDQFGNPTANDLTSLAANLTSSFQVRSSTASGFVAFSGGDVATVSPVQAGSPGQLIVPFTALKAGILSVSLGFSDGVQIQGSPYSGAVTAGDPFAAKCVASGPGLVGALSCPTPSAGCIAAYVYLTPRDANNNAVLDGSQSASAAAAVCLRFTVAFSNPQGVSGSPVPQLDTTPGRCVLAYIATVAGQQILTVTLDGRPIAGGGVYTVATQQGIGAASAAQSALSGDGINAVVLAGQVCKLTLTLVDANGIRLRTAVRTNVTAAVTSAKGTAASLVFKVADADNGQMVGSFKPVVSGAFTITVLVNGQPLGAYSNGFTTTVASGATDLLATRVEISPATAKSVPGPVVFCITPRDNGSNPQDYLVSSPDAFSVVVTQPDSSVVTLTAALTPANGTNLFVATFAPLQVGAYRAQVMWSNPSRPDLGASPVGGAAAVSTFGVTSGLPDAAQTELHWQAQAGMQGVTLARAGIPAQLRVSLKDTGGNRVSTTDAKANPPAAAISAALNPVANATVSWNFALDPLLGDIYNGTYVALQSGDSVLDFTVTNRTQRFPGPLVIAGAVSPANSTASGPGVGTLSSPQSVQAGVQSTFSLFPKDYYGNAVLDSSLNFRVKLTLNGSQPTALNSDHVTFVTDHYEVGYTPIRAGNYSVAIFRSNVPFGGGPYFVTVLPGPASAAAAKLSPASTANCTSGGTRVITVYTYDAFGNPSTTAGDSLTVSVTGTDPVSGQMVASALGQYMFNYTCVTASNQKSLLTVTVTSHSISTPIVSNLPLTTLPGPVSPANIQVSPPGILTAGAPFPVSFTALDANGNQLLTGGLSLTLQAAMGALSPVILPVADRGDGTYQATLVLTAAGTYQLSANVSGQQFYPGANASQTVIVQPATPAAALTAVALPTNFTAGAPSSFTVQLRDQFSNPVPTGLVSAANLQLYSVSSQTGASSPLVPSITQDPSTGIYTVAFTPLAAGLLRVALTVNGVLALNSSTGQLFSAPVLPGALSPGNCHVTGAGFLVGAASGVPASFLISANDAFNNSVAALPPGTTFDVTFSDQTLSLSAPISLQASGVYVASYTPTLAQVTANPTLTITVGFNGTNIATSAVKVWAQPGPVSVANSRVIDASGIPVGSAVKGAVGTPLQLFIQPRDAAGLDIRSAGAANLFSATVPSLGNVVPVALSDGTGRYALSFTPPRAGLIAVQITSYTDSTRALANSPMMAQIAPGPTAAATAQLLQAGGSQPFSTSTPRVAGVEDIIVVRSYDAQGNVQVYSALAGGDVYAAALTGPANVSASLTDNQDGTYALRYTATLSGTYNLTVSLRQGSALVPVANQPLQITMINSAFSIAQSSARPAPALTTTAASGVPFVFTIVARDGFGNPYTTGDKSFAVALTGPASLPCSAAATSVPSEFQASCTPGLVGTYEVTVTDASDAHAKVPGTPFQLLLLPGAVSAATSSATGSGLSVGYVGQTASFTVTARDAAGNVVSKVPSISFVPKNAADPTSLQIALTGCANDGTNCQAVVTYVPVQYGTIKVVVSYGATVVGTFSPAIAPAAAAALLGAQLTASLGGILLTFDQDTNGGRLQYATTTSALSGTCPKLLDPGVIPKLGSGTVYCTWQTRRTLLITLGYNSTILPVGSAAPDAVTILPGVIANAASNSFNASGSVPLQGPETAPVPVASVVAPAAVGVCDPVTLSAAATGGGGRPLQYSYYVQGPNDDYTAALTAKLARFTAAGSYSSITLSSTDLGPGLTYTFTVTATNFLGFTSSPVAVTVAKQSVPVPILTLANPTTGPEHRITWTSSDMIRVSATGRVPGNWVWVNGQCVPGGGNLPLKYTWQQLSGPIVDLSNLGSMVAQVTTASFASPTLVMPGSVLQVGFDYSFQLSCAQVDNTTTTQASSVQVTLSLQAQPITVSIPGGTTVVNAANPLVLAVAAKDPDHSVDISGRPIPFQYVWSCAQTLPDAAAAALFENDAANNYGQQLVIPGGVLPDGVYTFTVQVSKEPLASGRSNVPASATVTVVSAAVIKMGVSVQGNDISAGMSASRYLQLTCTSDTPGTAFSWAITSAEDPRAIGFTVSADGSQVTVPPNSFSSGHSYVVTCSGNSSVGVGATGFASLPVMVLNIPSGGTISASYPQPFVAGLSMVQAAALNWVPSADAQSGSLQYQFRYSISPSIYETIVYAGASSTASFNLPAGRVTLIAYINNPGTVAAASPGDQPTGARFVYGALTVTEAPSGPQRRLLSAVDSVSASFSPWGRSLLDFSSVTYTNADNSFDAIYLPAAYQSVNYAGVLTWAATWATAFGPAQPLATGCGAGSQQMRTEKADVLKIIAALDQSAPPAYTPGIDSTPGATIAVQHACALASLLSVPDEIALALLPPGAANNTLSSSVAETQPAIQSAVVTFLPKLQMVAQYGLATSPCGASNGSTVACDNYQCFTAAADALLNALALHCASLTLPSSWWSDAAAFAPVLLAKIYGDDPTVSKPEVPTSIQGHSFDWTAIQAAPSDSSIQGTAGGFGFAVPVSGGGVTAYAVAYGDGIVVPLAAAKTSGNGPIKSAALFLASNGASFSANSGTITFSNLAALAASSEYAVDVYRATGCSLWKLFPGSSVGVTDYTACAWTAVAANVSVAYDATAKSGTAAVDTCNAVYVLHTRDNPLGSVNWAVATIAKPDRRQPMFDLVVLGRASASASVTGVSLTDAPATDPITGVIVYYKGDSQPVTTWPGQAAPVAAAAVYFTQGADDPGAFYPFDGTVVFYALPTPAAGVAYVIDVYQASDCTLPAPPLPTDSFSGCSWDLVSENNAVTFAPGEQTGTYTPGQAEWNGVFVLHTVPTASAPAPPAPVKASGNTYDPTATSVVSAAVDTDWTYSFVTTGTDLITVTSVTYPTGAQPPVGFNNLPSSTVVGAVGLYLTQGSSAYTPANGTISFNNIPSLTSKRRSLLAVSHVYTVDFYAATGCQPAMPPVNATAFFGCSWTVSRDLPVTYDPTREKAIFAPGTSGLWNGLYLLHAILAPNPPPAQTDAPTPTPTSPPAMPAPTDTPSPGVAIGGTDRKTVLGMGLAIGLGGALFIAAAFAYVSRVRAEAAEAAVATSPPLVSQDDGLPRGSSQEPFEVDAPPFPMPEHAPLEWGESSAGAYEAALEGEAVYVADGGDAGGAYPAGDEGPPEGLRTHPISPKREATLSPAQDGSADPALEQDVPLDDSTLRRRSRTAGSVFDDFGA